MGSIINRRNSTQKKTLFFVLKVLHKNRSGDVLNTFTEGCFVAAVFCLVSAVTIPKVRNQVSWHSIRRTNPFTLENCIQKFS